ncbi:hypothetical protein Cpir12675_001886 [Ceratocystis pirilliformis]|uniref:Uncharacterized protein n=1 Tax=Ceratocystis pirilliformis TaxID=259994 RepID=A0ABR3ZE96_9PEZI
MLGKLTRSRSLRTLRKAPPAIKDKERTKYTATVSDAGTAALSDNSKHIITNSSHPKARGTMVATDATVVMNPHSSAVTPTTKTVAGKADLTASRPSGRPVPPPKSAQAESETIPHGPSELALIPAVSVPRDYVSEVSNGAAENTPRSVSTRPRARTDTQALLRPKWGDQDRISLAETRPGAIAAITRSGASAKLMSETKKHQEPDRLEGTSEARLRSKFASFQNSAVPTRSRSMREPPSYTRSLHNRQAALDIEPSSNHSSASASPPSRSTSHSNNHSSHSLATPFASPPLRSTTTTTITSVSSRTRSISVIYTKPPSSVFFEHHPTVSPLSVTPLATAVSPSRQTSSKQTSSSTSSPNPTPSRSVGLRRAASTKQYDADRSKRYDLVSPLRLSPPDLEKPQLSSLAGQLKRSQSTSSVRRTTCITTSIDAIATAPLSSLNPTYISLLHPHQLNRDQGRPSTSSGESFTQPKISSLNSRLSSQHKTYEPIICGSAVAAQTGHINAKAPSTTEPPNSSTDSNMATIPTSSSVTSLVRPKHDFNKRVSRDDLYINTRTGKTTFRSYHVPIRGRVPSPKESPRSESPAVTLVRTQTPDSIGEVVDLPIGMALGSPTFVTVGSPAPAISLNSDVQSKAQRNNRAKDANTFPPMAPTSTSSTSAKIADAQHEVSPDKAKKWRFFGGRSRSRKHTTEHAQGALPKPGIPSVPVRQSSGDDARRPTTKELRNVEKMTKGTTRITPEEAAMFKPRKTLKRGPSVRLNNKMEISGPTSLQRVPTTVAMPGLDTAAAAATEMHHIDWQSGAQDSKSFGLLSLNIPDSKFDRYSIMFNGILQREGVCSSTLQSEPATSRHPGADDRALFLEKQASLLGRSQTVTSKPKVVEVVNKPQNKDMGRQLTSTRSSTFPIGVKDDDTPAVTASPMSPEQSKSPAFSLFPAAPSQQQKTTIPLASVLSGSTESLPWREVNQDSKEALKPLAFQHKQTQSPTEIGTAANNITDVANSPQKNSATEHQKVLSSRAANAHHISSSEVVPFVLVDSSKTVVPKNMPRLRYRNALIYEATEASPSTKAPVTATNLLHALSAAGMTSDATVRAISNDLERQASTASTRSDKNPIVLDNTNAFPQPPAARSANKKSAYVPSSSPIRGPTQASPIRHMKVQTHNIRNEPHTQSESSSVSLKLQTNQYRSRAPAQPFLEAKFEEEPLPHSSPTKPMLPMLRDTKPSVVAMMALSSESLQMQRSPLGPNTSVLVTESDDEIEVAAETAIPQPVPYASSVSAASGASSSATSLNTRQRSESNTTTSSKLTTSTQDEAEIALRNAVEVSIARQISVSRKHRQMLQKSGLIQISPTIKGGRS